MDISGGRAKRRRAAAKVGRGAFMLACAETPAPGRAMTLYEAARADMAMLGPTAPLRIRLEHMTEIRRLGAFAQAFATRYGLSPADMDALISRAQEIEQEG